jgi:hypothetical protein
MTHAATRTNGSNRRRAGRLAALLLAALVALDCGQDPPGPRREAIGGYTVVHLYGSPYEMGRQHGRLLREELAEGIAEIQSDVLLKVMFAFAKMLKLDELARLRSTAEIVWECTGLVDEVGDLGWTMEMCLVLNTGDMVAEFARVGVPTSLDLSPGCAQLVVAGGATADGRLYHARILDWSRIEYLLRYPILIVRHPDGEIPHVVVGFPGNLSPYQGMNAEGLVVASNEVNPKDSRVDDRTGTSHVQLNARLLARAGSLDEAASMIRATNSMTLETIVVSDGTAGAGAVFEMAPTAVASRALSSDGVVMATNHFLEPSTASLDRDPAPAETTERYARLQQLTRKGGTGSLYGQLTPETLVQIMRDRTNAITGKESPATEFDDSLSLATNGALYQLVFDPARRLFWLAAGAVPVPQQPFTGFSLGLLLGEEDAPDHPATIP